MTRLSFSQLLASMCAVTLSTLVLPAFASETGKSASAGNAEQGRAIVTAVCGSCHGADGNSPSAANPKLAGQHAAYLFKQMREFKPGVDGQARRTNAIMNGMITPYDEAQMQDIAAYFSSRKPAEGMLRQRETLALGQQLYRAGNAARGLPACAGCHGPAGAGLPPQYPRIGGQHAEYLETQLKAFRNGERNNDPNQMMRMIAVKMTDSEIRAVADYIAGLH